ncbi:DUF6069 family protein [Actinoallomurus oryzae]|jgi:hypothetical protein|uniref:DUF6069 family protein n=1 Tax=Actinoallomurus oryzae TaxID=502180 RepID=A0ABP8P7K3_9ACTN
MRSTDMSWDEQTRADASRLWAGGAATALVAAGVALIGVMVLHKILHAPILSPGGLRQAADYAMFAFPVSAAILTLLATGLLHLLMSTTPQASQFFTWIASLFMVLVVLQVFLHDTDLLTQLETAAFYLLIGIAIITSLLGVSRSAVRHHRHQAYRDNHADGYASPYADRYADRSGYRQEPWR